jgi:hypothetical protein
MQSALMIYHTPEEFAFGRTTIAIFISAPSALLSGARRSRHLRRRQCAGSARDGNDRSTLGAQRQNCTPRWRRANAVAGQQGDDPARSASSAPRRRATAAVEAPIDAANNALSQLIGLTTRTIGATRLS